MQAGTGLTTGSRRTLCFALGALLASGCGGAALVRIPSPDPGSGAPAIQSVVDLGGLPIAAVGELGTGHSDGRFTPGEWVALVGANLSAATRVTVGPVDAPVAGYLKGGSILIRVPRGLPPGRHSVTVQTPAGQATAQLPASIYAFGADTNGDSLRFRRIGPDSGAGFEDAAPDIKFEKARFFALSPDGAIMYAIQKPVEKTSGLVPSKLRTLLKVAKKVKGGPVTCQVLVVHVAGKDGPQTVRSFPLTLSAKPSGMAVGPQGQLVILHKRKATLFDLSDPVQPRETTTLSFATDQEKRTLIDAIFLDGGQWLAVLEAYENRVHLVDMKNPAQPRMTTGVVLSDAIDQPFSIDLAPGDDDRSLWVLQGPNLRLSGKRLLDGLKGLWKDVKKLQFRQAMGTAGGAIAGAGMADTLSRLVQLALQDGELRIVKSIMLPPEIYPFFIQPDRKGSVYVSGINRAAPDFGHVEFSISGLKSLLDQLKSMMQVGRILKVSATDGSNTTELQGFAIYYDIGLLPAGQLLVSVVRLNPVYFPPKISLDWGFEIGGKGFVKLREIANSTFKLTEALKKLLPPYSYEQVGAQ